MNLGKFLPEEITPKVKKVKTPDIIEKAINITSDEARTAYFLLSKKQSRKSTVKCLVDIINYLNEMMY